MSKVQEATITKLRKDIERWEGAAKGRNSYIHELQTRIAELEYIVEQNGDYTQLREDHKEEMRKLREETDNELNTKQKEIDELEEKIDDLEANIEFSEDLEKQVLAVNDLIDDFSTIKADIHFGIIKPENVVDYLESRIRETV